MSEAINPPLRLLAAFQAQCGQAPETIIKVPGREMWLAALIEQTHKYTIIAPDVDGRTTFDRQSAKLKRTYINRPLPRWARYTAGTTLILSDDGLTLPGAEVVIVGEEPPGPRYEHALGMAWAALWYQVNQRDCDVQTLLNVLQRVKDQYMT